MRSRHPAKRIARLSMVLGWALLSPIAAAGNEVHRCIDQGRVTYSDRACGDRSEVITISTMTPVSLTVQDRASTYVQSLPVALGMSPRTVFDSIGRPYETVAALEGRSLVEYWVYRGGNGTTRVAFQEGRVTRVDTR